jgi:hypothetical protein
MRQRIMGLREDPATSAMMAGAFAARNGQQLEQALGRKPSEGELYMAHFLGASGARELISLAKSNPDASAAGSFREAAAANRSVFFDRSGRARSAQEVYANLAASFSAPPTTAQAPATAATRDAAQDMFRVKGEGKPMHGLFRSNGEPVATAVADAWTRMGRRAPVAAPETTRVAFFPRETLNREIGARAIRSDAEPSLTLPTAGRGAVTVELPPSRPGSGVSAVNPASEAQSRTARARRTAPEARPLDLMQFMAARRS